MELLAEWLSYLSLAVLFVAGSILTWSKYIFKPRIPSMFEHICLERFNQNRPRYVHMKCIFYARWLLPSVYWCRCQLKISACAPNKCWKNYTYILYYILYIFFFHLRLCFCFVNLRFYYFNHLSKVPIVSVQNKCISFW